MTPVCPFVKVPRPDDASSKRSGESQCKHAAEDESRSKSESPDSGVIEAKCPLGYDSRSFKIGPLSCVICQALLFEGSKCVPCTHIFCKVCISHFKDCPICGADIEKVESDEEIQKLVDKFIDGHARIKRSPVSAGAEEIIKDKPVIYEDVSLERGSFLVQQAMRAFRAQNVESAKSRLSMCASDIREQLKESGNKPELCSQLGAVLGMLGDCCRATGDAGSAVTYFEESVDFLSQVPTEDMEIIHTLSVSLNKIGDLKYYDGDLQASRSYYNRSLDVRRNALNSHTDSASLTLDIAVSLAKVADVDRGLGNEEGAVAGFREAVNMLESMKIDSSQVALEQRRQSVLEFLNSQIAEKQADQTK